jgi:hypothetical protein
MSKKILEKQWLPMHFLTNIAASAESDRQRENGENDIIISVGEIEPEELL